MPKYFVVIESGIFGFKTNLSSKLESLFQTTAVGFCNLWNYVRCCNGHLGRAAQDERKITGRFADILAYMYLATAVLGQSRSHGRPTEDLPVVHYTLKYSMSMIQAGFDGLFDNLKIPGLRWFLKGWLGSWSRINSVGSLASDGWSHLISSALLADGSFRNRLTEGIFIPKDRNQQLARLEHAFQVSLQAEAAERKVKKAIRDGVLPKKKLHQLLDEARSKNVILESELKLIQESDAIRFDAIMVDDFDEAQYHGSGAGSGAGS